MGSNFFIKNMLHPWPRCCVQHSCVSDNIYQYYCSITLMLTQLPGNINSKYSACSEYYFNTTILNDRGNKYQAATMTEN